MMCKVSVCVTIQTRALPSLQARLPAGSGLGSGPGRGLRLAAQVVSRRSLAVSGQRRRGQRLSYLVPMHVWSKFGLQLRGVFSALSPRTCPDWASLLWPLPAAWSKSTACRTPMPCTPTGSRATLVRLWFPFIFDDLTGGKVYSRLCSAFF